MKLKLIAIMVINLTAMASCATQPVPAYTHASTQATSTSTQIPQ